MSGMTPYPRNCYLNSDGTIDDDAWREAKRVWRAARRRAKTYRSAAANSTKAVKRVRRHEPDEVTTLWGLAVLFHGFKVRIDPAELAKERGEVEPDADADGVA